MNILRKLTTDKELWDAFVEYIDDAIAKQHKSLEQATEAVSYTHLRAHET